MVNFINEDGELYLIRGFLDAADATSMARILMKELAWQEEYVLIAGRRIPVPRLVCWYGDPGAHYTYSGAAHAPLPWTPTVGHLRERIEILTHHSFNSVLANLYRDGNDSMGWHADKEKELGRNPFIASLSLGAERLFKLRHTKTGEGLDLTLSHGSLLLMGGRLQHAWRHCVPKMKHIGGSRINLTFRRIYERVTS